MLTPNTEIVVSFNSINRPMHLSAGLPFFMNLTLAETSTLTYSTMREGFLKNMEFTFYYLNDIYLPHQSDDSIVNKAIEETSTEPSLDDRLNWTDFYPDVKITDMSLT